jgi:hypothetical protein
MIPSRQLVGLRNDRIAILLIGLSLVGQRTRATEIMPVDKRSDYEFMSPATKAIQDDDSSNPGMFGVDSEALWNLRTARTKDPALTATQAPMTVCGGWPCGCSKMCLVVGEDCDRGISSAERKFGRDFCLNPIHGFRALWHSSKRSCVMRRIVHAETGMPVRSPKEFMRRGVRSDDAGHQPPGRR